MPVQLQNRVIYFAAVGYWLNQKILFRKTGSFDFGKKVFMAFCWVLG